MPDFSSDLRRAVRVQLRTPLFALTAIFTLALAIGANTAIFSVVRALFIEPLPYGAPDELIMIWKRAEESDVTWLSAREVLEYRAQARSLSSLGAWTDLAANLTGGEEPERVTAAAVLGDLFRTLGVDPALGRTIDARESEPGSDRVVVLGWNLWQRRWGGDPGVIGTSILVNDVARTVIGIMPPDFRLPLDYREDNPSELWVPAGVSRTQELSWGNRGYFAVARLAPGRTHAQADAELAALMRAWEDEGHLDNVQGQFDRSAVPLQELITGPLRGALLTLFAAVTLVLLIACANVANLLLARSEARRREIATMAALGAGRARIVRRLLAETAVLSLAAALLGILLAWLGLRMLLALAPAAVLRLGVGLDPAVLLFTLAAAALTTALAGVVPALHASRPDLAALLAAGARTTSGARIGMRRGLLTFEIALSVLLLVAAGLLLRSFAGLRATDLGYQTGNILTLRLDLPPTRFAAPEQAVAFHRQLTDDVARLPGVLDAGAVRILPLTGTIGDWSITIEGKPELQPHNPNGDWQIATPGYFEALRVRPLAGRTFNSGDDADGSPVVLVNETMARRYWPEGALGKRFHLGTSERPWMTIVGILPDVRHNAVIEEPRAEMYVPHAQWPLHTGSARLGMTLVVRTSGNPLAVLPGVREHIRRLDPALPIADVQTMEEVAARALARPRFTAVLLTTFAALALVLAAVGLHGVIAFMLAQRTRELGLRIALGATPRRLLSLVLREALALAAAGTVLGLAAALAAGRVLESQLHDVSSRDPLILTLVPLLLTAVTTAATWWPARRAAHCDPIASLRE